MGMSLFEIAAVALDEWENEQAPTNAQAPKNAVAAKLMADLSKHDEQYHGGQAPKGECKYRDKVMKQASALGVAGQMQNADGSNVDTSKIDSRDVKASSEWQQYVTDRRVQDSTYSERLKALGVDNPTLNGAVETEEQKKVVDEWRKEVDKRRDAYLKQTLGDAEAHCVDQLATIIDAGGEKAEKAVSIAQDIVKNFPDENDPRNVGAKKVIERAERKRHDEETAKKISELEAKVKQLEDEKKAAAAEPAAEPASAPAPSEPQASSTPNEFKVGRMTYVDLSNLGFWDGLKEAFKAGFNGKEVVTRYDKISGRWDRVKSRMSASQRSNYDNLAGGLQASLPNALGRDAFVKALASENLSEDQRTDIQMMLSAFDQQHDPMRKLSIMKKLRDYVKEGRIGKDGNANHGTGGFDGLTKRFNGTAPTTDIYEPVPDDEKDTSFSDKVKKGIEDRLANEGIGANIVSVKNGPSVVQFEIQRSDNKTGAALANALKDMQNDLGVTITYEPDHKSGKERTGYIRINNPHPRDAGLRALLEKTMSDEKTKKKVSKMWSPFLAGETADGDPLWIDLRDHGLLAGDSNAGKSERLRGGLAGAMHTKSPNQLQVLFNAHANSADYEDFADDPHTAGIAKTTDEVVDNLKRADDEWQRRQKLFAEVGARDLDDYNAKMAADGHDDKQLPAMLIVTDELTDLLRQRPDAADSIRGILTNGRKFGVAHLGATQDPRADNVPTDLKGANRMGVNHPNGKVSEMIFGENVPELKNIERQGGIMVKTADGIKRLRGTYANKDNTRRLVEYNKNTYATPKQ